MELCDYCVHRYVDDEDKCRCGYDKPHECDEPCYIEDLDGCCGEFKPTAFSVESVEKLSRFLLAFRQALKEHYGV